MDKRKGNKLSAYYVVEFITRGRQPSIKKVDVVVGSWLFINNKKAATRFPEAPYNNLQEFLINQSPALSTWPSYNVKIRGRAETLDEALAKLSDLNQKETALTMSSGESAADVEQNELHTIRKSQFLQQADTFSNRIAASTSASDVSSKQLEASLIKQGSITKQISIHGIMNTDNLTKEAENFAETENESDDDFDADTEFTFARQDSTLSIANNATVNNFATLKDKRSTTATSKDVTLSGSNIKRNCISRGITNDGFVNDDDFEDVGFTTNNTNNNARIISFGSATNRNNASEIIKNISKKRPVLFPDSAQSRNYKKSRNDVSKKPNFEDLILDQLTTLSTALMELQSSNKIITEELLNIKSLLMQQKNVDISFVGNGKQLAEKYSYEIPFTCVRSFQEFDNELANPNSSLCADVKTILASGLDNSLVSSKCIVKMMKMFLSKDVAATYTAVKQVKGKKVMMNTNFYSCIEGIIKQHRISSKLSIGDQEFTSALSNVLTNANAWKDSNVFSRKNKQTKVHMSTNNDNNEKDDSMKTDSSSKENDLLSSDGSRVINYKRNVLHEKNDIEQDELLGIYNLLPVCENDSGDYYLSKLNQDKS